MNAAEISRVLSTKGFYNHYPGKWVDVSWKVEDFLQQQTEQTYDFAEFIGLGVSEIPSVVFFDTLQSPDKYVRWSPKMMDDYRVKNSMIEHIIK